MDNPENSLEAANPTEETPQVNAGERLFTQAELDKVISNRLERERVAKSNDVNLVKDKVKTVSQELDLAQERIEKYETIIKGLVTSQMKDLPKSIRELVEKLDPADQINWLESNAAELAKPKAAKTVTALPTSTEISGVDMEKLIQNKMSKENIYGTI